MMRTRAGEISIDLRELRLLSKAISPLPVIKQKKDAAGAITEFGAFADIETRYRRRYVDPGGQRGSARRLPPAGGDHPRHPPLPR